MSIFSCACCPSVCLLWRNGYSVLSPSFDLVVCFLVFSCMSCLCILGIIPLLITSFANNFVPFCRSFHFVSDFLCYAKAFHFNQVPFILVVFCVFFCFYLFCLRRLIQDNIVTIYVRECFAYVLFWKFYGFKVYVYVFNPFCVYFCMWCEGVL